MIKNCGFFYINFLLKQFFWTYWMQYWRLATLFQPMFKNKIPLNDSMPENDKQCFTFTKIFYFASLCHRTHTLKTWHPPLPSPPSPAFLFEEPEKVVECTTTRERIYIPNFFFWIRPLDAKKLLLLDYRNSKKQNDVKTCWSIYKKDKFYNLFRKIFFWLPVDTWKAVSTTLLKDFRQVTKNDIFVFLQKNDFPHFCPLDMYKVVLTNL